MLTTCVMYPCLRVYNQPNLVVELKAAFSIFSVVILFVKIVPDSRTSFIREYFKFSRDLGAMKHAHHESSSW